MQFIRTCVRNLDVKELQDVVPAFVSLVEQLQDYLPHIQSIVVDDASGRLPGLFFNELLKAMGSNTDRNGKRHTTRFYAFPRNGTAHPRLIEDIKKGVIREPVLVVTEHVYTGTRIDPTLGALSNKKYVVASVSRSPDHAYYTHKQHLRRAQLDRRFFYGSENVVDYDDDLERKIFVGDRVFWRNSRLSGVVRSGENGDAMRSELDWNTSYMRKISHALRGKNALPLPAAARMDMRRLAHACVKCFNLTRV